MNALILTLNQQETLDPRQSGKKGCALAALHKRGFRVPEFVVVTPQAFKHNLTAEQIAAWEQICAAGEEIDGAGENGIDVAANEFSAAGKNGIDAASEQIEQILSSIVLKDDFLIKLTSAARALAETTPRKYAVRSSAVEEDGASSSFAGQFESLLNIDIEHLGKALVDVWRSAYSPRVIAYRQERGLPRFTGMPAVLVQLMIDAEISGVAFSADPVAQDRNICVVEAVFGLGHGLVSGELEADRYRIARDGSLLERVLQRKQEAFRCGQNEEQTIEKSPVPEDLAQQSALTTFQCAAISRLARKCERYFGTPQDLEWSIEKGRIYLLQSRPISTWKSSNAPALKPLVTLWDNSNISESYNGVTTPLTFSFARKAYENVYLQFCRLMQVPQYKIEENASVFPCMIGLLNGTIYYNLLNWYRLLSLLPGYSVNRRFMEQMMGVKEGVPPELLPDTKAPSLAEKIKDLFALVFTVVGLVYRYCRLDRDISTFHARLDKALADDLSDRTAIANHTNITDHTASEASRTAAQTAIEASCAVAHNALRYRSLEQKLLTRWDAPLINDFFAMIFYGLLSSLCKKWCGDQDGTLHNALVTQQGGLISAEPATRIRAMASLAAGDHRFIKALTSGNLSEAEQMISERPAFEKQYRSYLSRFGDRCLEELKLESTTLNDDPALLLKSIGQTALTQSASKESSGKQANSQQSPANPSQQPLANTDFRTQAKRTVAQKLSISPLKRMIFSFVLKNARARVRDRENLRFERTRLFGRVRRILLEIGNSWSAVGILKSPRDVFYLQLEEILSMTEGTSACTNLQAIVEIRQKEFAQYRQIEPLPTRVRTEDSIYASLATAASLKETSAANRTSILKGIGCCPGTVRGRVRVVLDPRSATITQGEILVAKRTDPGWIMLFPAASALIVEHGSLLSHSAIVARELGLPAVISVSSATSILHTGDYVELDGATGQVRVLERAEQNSEALSA
jgi:rifampicin phosphotransferase